MHITQVDAIPLQQRGVGRLVMENLGIALAYTGFAYIAFVVFHQLGVTPMPIWPSAALAIVVAVYRGKFIFAVLLLPPAMTATGGVGFKWILGVDSYR